MDALDNADRDVKAVEVQIAAIERALLEPNADISYLRKKEDQLRKKEEQIRDGKNKIQDGKNKIQDGKNKIQDGMNKIQDGMNLDKEILVVEIKARQSPGK